MVARLRWRISCVIQRDSVYPVVKKLDIWLPYGGGGGGAIQNSDRHSADALIK